MPRTKKQPTPEELAKRIRADLLDIYEELREELVQKLRTGEAGFADTARLIDRMVHWLRVLDEKPTDVTKHWLEELHERLGTEGLE